MQANNDKLFQSAASASCFDELGMDPLSITGRLTGGSNSALMCSAFLRIERCVMAA